MIFRRAAAVLLLALLPATASAQDDSCARPQPVCAARDAVFAISGFDPVGSAVRLGETRLVTARHVVADMRTVRVFLADGSPLRATVVLTDYPGDLVLLEVVGLPPGPVLAPAPVAPDRMLYTIGADVGRQRIRAYDPGRLQFAPPSDKPLARLHHDAYSQPGNSGGALVDEKGDLVGIVASGGEGRFEAIPATAIAELTERSGSAAVSDASAAIGAAVRICTTLLDHVRDAGPRLEDQQAKAIEVSCTRSGNRQLSDLAGQTLGRAGRTQAAIALFELGLAEDPNAVNTRIGLAITYHLARDFEAALPHLAWLLDNAGDDLQVLRLAIQAGAWGGDLELAESALARLKEVNPESAPAAERFLENPPARPPKLP